MGWLFRDGWGEDKGGRSDQSSQGGGFLWELTGFGKPPEGKGASEANPGWFSNDEGGITGFAKPKTKRGARRMIDEGAKRSAITGFRIEEASEAHQANSIKHTNVVQRQKNSWWK